MKRRGGEKRKLETPPPPITAYAPVIDVDFGKSSKSVQLAMLKACDACADMGQ